ncbi:MAG: chemotaxis protein CheW, partial [archaeon]
LMDVKEIIQTGQIRRLPKSYDFIEGIYNYRGNIIHIINLRKKLSLDKYKIYKEKGTSSLDEDSDKKFIIILSIEGTEIGFYVNHIVNITRVNMEQFVGLSPIVQTGITDTKYIKGIIRFKDRPRIYIDLHKILDDAEKSTIKENQTSLI